MPSISHYDVPIAIVLALAIRNNRIYSSPWGRDSQNTKITGICWELGKGTNMAPINDLYLVVIHLNQGSVNQGEVSSRLF